MRIFETSLTPDQVKRLRTAAGLTQAQAGQLVGRSKHCFRQWEQAGKQPMPAEVAARFVLAVAATPGELEAINAIFARLVRLAG